MSRPPREVGRSLEKKSVFPSGVIEIEFSEKDELIFSPIETGLSHVPSALRSET